MRSIVVAIALLGIATIAAPAPAQYQPPRHTQPAPPIGRSDAEVQAMADQGVTVERDRMPQGELAEHRRLSAALAGIGPQRAGTVDAYVVAVGLDSDAVFGREVREAGRVLARRYGAESRTVVLAGTDGTAPSDLARGSPANIATVLARVAEQMDRQEDVLVLYASSHGARLGIVYNDGDEGFGIISPAWLAKMLARLGIRRRIVMVSACYAGVFVPALADPDAVTITAADADHTSFGCQADSDWTFFGDALLNHGLRKRQPLAAAQAEAAALIRGWESRGKLDSSHPQIDIGADARRWLDPLERAIPPAATQPVGRPATTLLGY